MYLNPKHVSKHVRIFGIKTISKILVQFAKIVLLFKLFLHSLTHLIKLWQTS